MSRKITRKGIIRKLDKLVSEIVIGRDRSCIVCGSFRNLTCGHLFSRIAYSTRWDLDNCFAQCLSCNLKHEHDPYPMTETVKAKGINIDELHRKYVTPIKFKTFELIELYEKLKLILDKQQAVV